MPVVAPNEKWWLTLTRLAIRACIPFILYSRIFEITSTFRQTETRMKFFFFFPSSEKRFALYDRICSSLFFREYLLTSIFFFFKVRQKFYILAPDERDPKKKESICIFCLLIEIKAKLLFAFNFVDINAR